MALKKSLELDNGFSAEYIRIIHLEYDANLNRCQIRLGIYKDHASRLDGKNPALCSQHIYESPSEITLSAMYTHLKTLEQYSNSEDV